MNDSEIYSTPTLREAHSVIRRKKFLCNETHRFLLRKLNDLKGIDDKEIDTIEKFITFAVRKYNLSPFDAVLYYFYNTLGSHVNPDNSKWNNMKRWIVNSELIDNSSDYAFANIKVAITWIVSFRWASIYFRQLLKGLDYEESWVTDK